MSSNVTKKIMNNALNYLRKCMSKKEVAKTCGVPKKHTLNLGGKCAASKPMKERMQNDVQLVSIKAM